MIKLTAFAISIAVHALLITALVLPESKTDDSKSILVKLKPPAPVEKIQEELPVEVESKSSEQVKITKADTSKRESIKIKDNQNEKIETGENSGMGFLLDATPIKTDNNEEIKDTETTEPQSEPSNVTLAPDIDAIKHAYEQSILKKIDGAKSYPPLAVTRGKEGRVKVDFVVHSSGDISELRISSKASFSAFNKATLKAVNDAAPFDPLPTELNISQMRISVWVSFSLNK